MFVESPSFPNESPAYRRARDELLQAEAELRASVEAVAARRRALPLGGKVPKDYVFDETTSDGEARPVSMSELFARGKDTLFVYSFMYGPEMELPCPMCTSIADALNGQVMHLEQRINLAVVARSPIERFAAFARRRGWTRLRLLSSARNTFAADYLTEGAEGDQWPVAHTFVKRDDGVHHFWNSELVYSASEQGQNQRHVDMLWPLWNVLDLTPEGRGTD